MQLAISSVPVLPSRPGDSTASLELQNKDSVIFVDFILDHLSSANIDRHLFPIFLSLSHISPPASAFPFPFPPSTLSPTLVGYRLAFSITASNDLIDDTPFKAVAVSA